MPAFQRKNVRFVNGGMNFNRSVDTIPDGQINYGRNIRSTQAGTVTSRGGLTVWAVLPGSICHSIARLNNFDPEVNFDYTYILGENDSLFVQKTPSLLNNVAFNPVRMPATLQDTICGNTDGLSGNPLTLVDMSPVGEASGWKYAGDDKVLMALGYYPGDDPGLDMARAITMGLPVPVNTTIPVGSPTSSFSSIVLTITWAEGAPTAPDGPRGVYFWTTTSIDGVLPGASVTIAGNPNTHLNVTGTVINVYPANGFSLGSLVEVDSPGVPFLLESGGSGAAGGTATLTGTGGAGGSGNLTGNYQWMFAFRRIYTGARSNPSAATRVTQATPPLALTAQSATMTLPRTPLDPWMAGNITTSGTTATWASGQKFDKVAVGDQVWLDTDATWYTIASVNTSSTPQTFTTTAAMATHVAPTSFAFMDKNVVVDVYRFSDTTPKWALVGSGPGDSIFVDNVPDKSLDSAPEPPQVADPVTGILRFNLFQPFPVTDIAKFGTGTVTQLSNGVWQIEWASGDPFNAGWLAGSFISIANGNYSIYQVRQGGTTGAIIEIAEDATGLITPGAICGWSTHEGTLAAGTPMRCLFGPWGLGETGAYVFGLGTDNQAGTLFWTNGNDPDSSDIANSLQVTPPSEPLMNGAVYDGTPYIWSTERMFRVFPSMTIAGQFQVEEIIGARGMYFPYALTVQSNGISDQSVTWRGKDGIYDFSSSGLKCLTDETMYPFFAHDNRPPEGIGTLYPWLAAETGSTSYPLDTYPQFHRLCWFEGTLFYDYPTGLSAFSTLVYETKQQPGGWIAFDQYFGTPSANSLARGIEISARNLKLAIGNIVYDYGGTATADGINVISCRLVTRAEDLGDPRGEKLWGDYYLDADLGNASVNITPRLGPDMTALATNALTGTTAGRQQQPLDFSAGLGVLAKTFALDVEWGVTSGAAPVTLYNWEPSYVPKPEQSILRATDWDDDGTPQNKYLFGCLITANTFAVQRTVEVHGDGDKVIATLAINHDGQSIKPYYFAAEPNQYEDLVTHEMRLVPKDIDLWELFSVKWFYTLWPEFTQFVPDYSPSDPTAYRGVAIEADTQGQDVKVQVVSEGQIVRVLTCNHPGRVQIAYSFEEPFLSTEVKLVPVGENWRQPLDWKVRWIGEPKPDLAALYSDWTDDGYIGAKFFQGFVLQADTQGQDRTLIVQYDGGQVGGTFTHINHSREMEIAYSFPQPFIAHQVRTIPDQALRYLGPFKIRWIWEPAPDLAKNWITQTTSHGLRGYHHHRDCLIALQSWDNVLLIVKQDDGNSYQYLIPSTGGNIRKPYEVLQPMKAKLSEYWLISCTPFRLFQRDCEVRIKGWGEKNEFRITKPFGDVHFERGARI
jgi:hypothetical protein